MLSRIRNLSPEALLKISFAALILGALSTWFFRQPGSVPDLVRGLGTGIWFGVAGGALLLAAVRRRNGAAGR